MVRTRLVRVPLRWPLSELPIAILLAIALLAGPRVGAASTITSTILADPVGEFTAKAINFVHAVTNSKGGTEFLLLSQVWN